MKLDMRKKQEKKETTKSTKKLLMTAKMKRAIAVYIAMVLIMTAGASTVFAADDPLTVINNLSTFIFGLIRDQICKSQSLDHLTLSSDSPYTSQLLLNTIRDALKKAAATN